MRILVSGRDGQVARSLAERASRHDGITLQFVGRPAVDLAVPGALARAIADIRPDLVINAAAYTSVDRAESEEDLAHRINAEAAGEGAAAAARFDIPFVQLSTDYVFDGTGANAWREDDPIAPINAYGRSKAEGERLVLAASPLHSVIRTSWLVSPHGHNFIKTMLRLAEARDEIAVVADQRGSPTSALDLAESLLGFSQRAASGDLAGIWHVAGERAASWAELARQVMSASAARGGPRATVREIASSDYPTPAPRPANSVLDTGKARERLGIALPDWEAGVQMIVDRLKR